MLEQKRGRSYRIRLLPPRVGGHDNHDGGRGGVDDGPSHVAPQHLVRTKARLSLQISRGRFLTGRLGLTMWKLTSHSSADLPVQRILLKPYSLSHPGRSDNWGESWKLMTPERGTMAAATRPRRIGERSVRFFVNLMKMGPGDNISRREHEWKL